MFSGQIPVIGSFPSEFFFAIPYVLTVIALVLFARKSVGPKASGENLRRWKTIVIRTAAMQFFFIIKKYDTMNVADIVLNN